MPPTGDQAPLVMHGPGEPCPPGPCIPVVDLRKLVAECYAQAERCRINARSLQTLIDGQHRQAALLEQLAATLDGSTAPPADERPAK